MSLRWGFSLVSDARIKCNLLGAGYSILQRSSLSRPALSYPHLSFRKVWKQVKLVWKQVDLLTLLSYVLWPWREHFYLNTRVEIKWLVKMNHFECRWSTHNGSLPNPNVKQNHTEVRKMDKQLGRALRIRAIVKNISGQVLMKYSWLETL